MIKRRFAITKASVLSPMYVGWLIVDRRALLRIAGYLGGGEHKMKKIPPKVVRRHELGYEIFAYYDDEHHPKCPCLPAFRGRAHAWLTMRAG